MFTGIITDIGRVRAIVPGGDTRMRIATALDLKATPLGASIACSGVCLTVIARAADWFEVQVSAETLSRTTIGQWREGSPVNLEQALRLGDELGGHMVSGHVDGVGYIRERRSEGESLRLAIEAPPGLASLIASKGAITVDGVSLTVNEVAGARFGVNIIPHTQAKTSLGMCAAGDPVNIEIDLLARHVARLLGKDIP
ncbi:MAG TPA: riboflavin synthase [Stellaceae bacterium]|nr:riboflavin synthase [Stellaceae bacterium]